MHTLTMIAAGLLLLGVLVMGARLLGARPAAAAKIFVPVWLAIALVNMAVGVLRAGYSVAAEAPILLVVFGVPAAVAMMLWRRLAP